MNNNGHIPVAPFRALVRTAPGVPGLADLPGAIHAELDRLGIPAGRLAGRRIAVTAGSRGIANLKDVVRAICQWLRAWGARPFVIPAMGSHGGSTAEGQRRILEEYGVCPEYVGAEILASMEVVCIGETDAGVKGFMDRLAWESDGVLVMNRVKPHTSFQGKIESGRLKMIAVGLGKREGAEEVHRYARKYGYEETIRSTCKVAFASGKILAGLGVVENEFHELAIVQAARPEEMIAQEEALTDAARRLVPRLPFASAHLLIVDELGKNISGTGMDTKVIGRGVPTLPGEAPAIDLIYVRDITAESGGNALGMGYADLIHEKLYRKIDLQRTYVNARTSLNVDSVRLPMFAPSDRDAFDLALSSLGSPEPHKQRLAWIRNTLNLNWVALSQPLAAEAASLPGWTLSAEAFEPEFDAGGNLLSGRPFAARQAAQQ
ncbi:MAG TPA: lactate racemase domain-containing protein [Terriglobia bacterium]|nr:lactate racemase domain-containing protein [Terriglobia bacterium]